LSELDNAELSYIADATINIYENNILIKTIDTSFYKLVNISDEIIYYSTDLKPQIGKEYIVEISAEGYETIMAEGVLPNAVSFEVNQFVIIDSFKYEYPLGVYWLDLKAEFNVRIDDPPFENNYYALYVLYFDVDSNYFITYSLTTTSDDLSIEGTDDINLQSVLFTDKLFNGEQHEISFNVDCTSLPLDNSNKVYVYLASYSEDTYLYRHSYALFQESYGDFFSQPVQVYSNIKNGYGIFGGYVTKRDSVVVF
jgi:hypothetical protein